MYTRSYHKDEKIKKITSTPEEFNFGSSQVMNEEDIPEGYSGMAVLREKEVTVQNSGSIDNNTCGTVDNIVSDNFEATSKQQRPVRRFKVATKYPSDLWSAEKNNLNENPPSCCESKTEKECPEICPNPTHIEENCNDQYQDNSFECKDLPKEKHLKKTHSNSFFKRSHIFKEHKTGSSKKDTRESTFFKKPSLCLKERSFSIEDLLLGGLILLLLNEGADDDVILIFGFLLFSGL